MITAMNAAGTRETLLDIMTRTNDGFRISEEDLRLRGPGDFFGSRQHGLPEMHVADLGADINVLRRAQEEAEARAWATGNKQDGGGKNPGGSGRKTPEAAATKRPAPARRKESVH